MSLSAGTRVGPYEIVSVLGAGGMGEVYRARDSALGRDVAIKVLPSAFTRDPDRVARFEREARALAALNHPNIATIHGRELGDSGLALVMELVEGPTLAERLAHNTRRDGSRGLPLSEALTIARQIAEALDAAHEKGIVHRDLKPANIKITPNGVVKVLDFGLAKLTSRADDSDAHATVSATITASSTREGLVVGTAGYMSPEQSRGQFVDKRTDIWAFGCVLYEMLTGRAAFTRETITDTFAAILEREPDWSAFPASVPVALERLLKRCLQKDPRNRIRDIGDVRIQLEDATVPAETAGTRPTRSVSTWQMAVVATAAIVVGGGATALWLRSGIVSNGTPRTITRTTVVLPPDEQLDTSGGAQPLALSPDGRRLVYAARREGTTLLYVRDLEAFEAKPIAGTEGARYPFFSPDGRSVAFFAAGKLKRVAIAGGSPVSICDAALVGRGGTWGPDGTIVFDSGAPGLLRVSASGGNPQPVKSHDPSTDARASWPHFLPNGRALLATIEGATLGVLSLESGTWRKLGLGYQAQYLASGHIVFHAASVREGELHAAPFDIERLAISGEAVTVLNGVFRSEANGGAYFAVAPTGNLVFGAGGWERTLVRVDRNGRRTPIVDERRGFRSPRISPEGRRVLVSVDPRPTHIWVYDLIRRTGIEISPGLGGTWTPDGQRVTYSTSGDIHWRRADGSAAAERRFELEGNQYAHEWSNDGQLLLFANDHPTNRDIWMWPPKGEPHPLIATPGYDTAPRLSAGNRWLAYESDESGRAEIYIRPFPNVDAGRWTVSTGGGEGPVWSPTGRELFYMNGTTMMAVAIEPRGATLEVGVPAPLFDGPFEQVNFDISPDGTHFIMVEADPKAALTQVHVVLNWQAELKQRVPSR